MTTLPATYARRHETVLGAPRSGPPTTGDAFDQCVVGVGLAEYQRELVIGQVDGDRPHVEATTRRAVRRLALGDYGDSRKTLRQQVEQYFDVGTVEGHVGFATGLVEGLQQAFIAADAALSAQQEQGMAAEVGERQRRGVRRQESAGRDRDAAAGGHAYSDEVVAVERRLHQREIELR